MKRQTYGARSDSFLLAASCLCLSMFCGCGTIPDTESATSKVNLLEVAEKREAKELPPEFEVTHRVEITTSMGFFVIGLYGNDAPKTVENFLKYVKNGHYVGKIFHRIIPNFMVQGGGFDAELTYGKTDLPIELEVISGLRHEAGVVSMARTGEPDSATSQFFICVGDALQLNGDYAAFGVVLQGMDVVQKMSKVRTRTVESSYRPMADVPVNPILIKGTKIL